MSAALERLGRQAEALDFFDEITLFTEHDLSAEFTSRMGRYLTPSCRGFGYWSWKPWVIHHVLQEMEEGDRILYLDAGCHINANGTERFREYVNMLDRDSRGMLVFTNGQPEYKWTQRRYLPPLRRFPRRRAYHAYPANCGRPCFPEKEPAHGKPDPGLAPCLLRPSASCGQHSFRLPQPAGFCGKPV